MLRNLLFFLYEKKLSITEVEVFLLMASGLSYKEAADARCCDVSTIKYHVTSIGQKLECRGRKDILKIIIKFYLPTLKDEIRNYLFPMKKGLDPILWAEKFGDDEK